jgi:hypothetical protein
MSGLSISSLNQYLSSPYAQNNSSTQSDLQNLGQALQSGNLTAAQSAFATLQKAYQSQTSQSTSSSGTTSPVSSDLTTLANALNTGNLTSAQAAFTQLQKDQQTQSGGHHHHHGGMGGAVQSLISQLSNSSSSSSSGTSTTGQTLNVQA